MDSSPPVISLDSSPPAKAVKRKASSTPRKAREHVTAEKYEEDILLLWDCLHSIKGDQKVSSPATNTIYFPHAQVDTCL